MKKTVLRVCCAFLLMAIAVASSVGVIGSVFAENSTPQQASAKETVLADPLAHETDKQDADLVLVRVAMIADGDIREIQLYRSNGVFVETLTPDAEGMVASSALTPGEYQAATEKGSVLFTVHENASIDVSSGCGWSDGEQLHLTEKSVGTLTIYRNVESGELQNSDGWLNYTLSDGDYYARIVLRENGTAQLVGVFHGVPYGAYMLRENGEECQAVYITAQSPNIEVYLP
ncbi:MAG: hypothetical protein LBM28_00505 [Oscillospiraceae bacterium]|jgi:hypothetical protein|nr:hypothetical protein [Oscillospiraceae bacterium]